MGVVTADGKPAATLAGRFSDEGGHEMVATATTARAPRAATPARWQKALQRA
ncbi:MAG: hypothetical protein QOJ59_3832, partial [Thermomicrobiales bacterium]|nr:hypothetical protein [Thermomicrobiales bacterium]